MRSSYCIFSLFCAECPVRRRASSVPRLCCAGVIRSGGCWVPKSSCRSQGNWLAGAIGEWLIERSCERLGGWSEGPLAGLWFALNVSSNEFSRDRRFAEMLDKALRRNRVAGSKLVLEISERSVRGGRAGSLEAVRCLAELGIPLTIDEFGTGLSNLAALRKLPVSKLKIDRSLVADVATQGDAAVIVQTVAAMAKGLGLALSAAGVENAAQLTRLQALGCEEWQGSLYSEPLEAVAFEQLLASARRAANG